MTFLKRAEQYAAWRCFGAEAFSLRTRSPLFTVPHKTDYLALFPLEKGGALRAPKHFLRSRDGFNVTDEGISFGAAIGEAEYCLYCHQRGKDSCSKGLMKKEGVPHPHDGCEKSGASTSHPFSNPFSHPFDSNPLGATLTGCPLEQKISEMNQLRQQGFCLGALATGMIDNPLLAATGERICNDCEKACIFQKQDPVKIPAIETQTLREILALPWGAEIYILLTRWNPLNIRRPYPKPPSGYQVLVAGMGPAGFTLAHYLLNEGHSVVGIDGLKIEPLPPRAFHPLCNVTAELFENLDERIVGGFGGVAEYGITVRWNKNFLTLIRLLLERQKAFDLRGGIRLGSQITPKEAIEKGFDHIALCLGAGQPKLLSIPNIFAKGVRLASDFLMGLQLSGAFKKETLANLQVRLPAFVVGGGLTAMDTATEILAYYPRQVETFLARYERLVQEKGQDAIEKGWSKEDHEIAQEFLTHGQALREERLRAVQESRAPDIQKLLTQWGGVRLLYRKRLTDSPAYRLNHEEVFKALQEGVVIQEETLPLEVIVDDHGAIKALSVEKVSSVRHSYVPGWPESSQRPSEEKQQETLLGKSLFLALGTQPNMVLSKEFPNLFIRDGQSFQALSEEGHPVSLEKISKPQEVALLVGATGPLEGRVSFFGDLHPSFSGSVVKAMASAKRGYGPLTRTLEKNPPLSTRESVFAFVRTQWQATVRAVNVLGPKIIEVIVHAPAAARHFNPGQFFRLQNFERSERGEATSAQGLVRPLMEGLALTGASADPKTGLISLIVLEMGGASSLCRFLKPGEPVVLMGPSGTGTELQGERHLLIGGGLGNAVLFSIGKSLRAAGKHVTYVAAYKNAESIFKPKDLEDAADQLIWCLEEGALPFEKRPQDFFYQGNVIQGLHDHQHLLHDRESLLVIGSDRMMHAVQESVARDLKKSLGTCQTFMASINAPMQCMMKEICAQCLQLHKNPDTGEETVVFSCTNQDQPLNKVDFSMLKNRLSQNALQEKITALWQERQSISLQPEDVETLR